MKILYKYRRISLNTIFDLMKNSIFFNDPNEFNDLFDAKLNVKFEGTEQQLRSFLTDPKRASDIFLNNGLRYLDGGLSYKEVFNYLEGIYDFIAKHVFRILFTLII